jgi:hypothetical protein
MSTQTKTISSSLQANLAQLPILQHFDSSQLVTNVNSYRKGEKPISGILKLLALLGIGYGLYLAITTIIPQFIFALGEIAYYGTIAAAILIGFVSIPWIFGKIRELSKFLAKNLIHSDPFGNLENHKKKLIQNQQIFRISKSKIDALKNDMQVEAQKSENDANKLQREVISLQGKCSSLKANLDEMIKNGGAEARNSDEYVNGQSNLLKLLAESQRMSNKLTQSKDFIQKYGTRAAVMKKMGQKLVMVEASMDIKIADFDATVEMLKKDYDFSQKSRAATDAAKSAMLFEKSWELDYALDVVTATIATDIAITSGNLRDIDNLTSKYSMDSDELYTNLNILADNIKAGKDDVPSAKKYNNVDYQFTSSDKIGSQGLTDMF